MKQTSVIACVLSIIALALGIYLFSAQRGLVPTKGTTQKVYVDSLVKQSVQEAVNPIFSTVDEVLLFREKAVEGLTIEDEFNSLPEEVLKNVATVVIKREGHVSRRGIVYEYRANREIYDNLPANDSTETKKQLDAMTGAANPPSPGDSAKPAGEVQISHRDTTINGKKYKVITTTNIDYE
jgi:hypothetical protein